MQIYYYGFSCLLMGGGGGAAAVAVRHPASLYTAVAAGAGAGAVPSVVAQSNNASLVSFSTTSGQTEHFSLADDMFSKPSARRTRTTFHLGVMPNPARYSLCDNVTVSPSRKPPLISCRST